jgi:hypothetical protein
MNRDNNIYNERINNLQILYKNQNSRVNNIMLDRQNFNINTRNEDQFNKDIMNRNRNINRTADFINIDRDFFNVNSNKTHLKSSYKNNNDKLNEMRFEDYLITNNIRNVNNLHSDNRLKSNNNKREYHSVQNVFENRMLERETKQINNQIHRINTIDTKNLDYNKYKKYNYEKFDPNL